MNISAIRDALKETLAAQISDVRIYDFIPDNPLVPCLIIHWDQIQYRQSFDGLVLPTFTILCLVSTVAMESSQERMDAWLSTSIPSIVDAIDNDQTLGGQVDGAAVTEARNLRQLALADGGTVYLACEVSVQVMA